ncbi:hypothetical protein NDI45_12175 [Leptolyngbya sp. GB1-A1]|uniref:hypothetical protein n=1 Tax=Leptolyngbya sp. GB1-A1 TaxID=2933908 RepID=UPI003296D25F
MRTSRGDTIADWIDRFVSHHWEHTPQNPTTKRTLENTYLLRFRKLPPDVPLTIEVLRETLINHRQGAAVVRCTALRLASLRSSQPSAGRSSQGIY